MAAFFRQKTGGEIMKLLALAFVAVFTFQSEHALAKTSLVPKYFSYFWNQADIIRKNNCYNYSTNRRTDDFAQPGAASGQIYKALTCEAVLAAASADLGLERTEYFQFNGKTDDVLIALVVAPNEDFHWYRRGDDNMWSHKPGGTEATNLDNSLKPITDPQAADRGDYTDFCGYFRLKNYIADRTEQNGGYVRIGNMTSLPPFVSEPSTVSALVFSGRRDPELPLKVLLTRLQATIVGKLAHDYSTDRAIGQKIWKKPAYLNRLGYRGILITDSEGLMFPAGTQVHVTDGFAYIQSPGENSMQLVHNSDLQRIEKALFREIKSATR